MDPLYLIPTERIVLGFLHYKELLGQVRYKVSTYNEYQSAIQGLENRTYHEIVLHEVNRICAKSMKNLLETRVQLNGYEAVPYFLQSSHWIVC